MQTFHAEIVVEKDGKLQLHHVPFSEGETVHVFVSSATSDSTHPLKGPSCDMSNRLRPSPSCWEIAKLVEKGRLVLMLPVGQWIDRALAFPGISLLPLDPKIAVASTQLPQPFHSDPADQIITATRA